MTQATDIAELKRLPDKYNRVIRDSLDAAANTLGGETYTKLHAIADILTNVAEYLKPLPGILARLDELETENERLRAVALDMDNLRKSGCLDLPQASVERIDAALRGAKYRHCYG